jgi:hypothetical protein
VTERQAPNRPPHDGGTIVRDGETAGTVSRASFIGAVARRITRATVKRQ